jgi:hypothetical protein
MGLENLVPGDKELFKNQTKLMDESMLRKYRNQLKELPMARAGTL